MICFSKNSLVIILVFGGYILGYGQDIAQVKYYNFFDQQVGVENTGLYQGIVYAEQYRTINEKNQFFKTQNFLKGSVCYDGQCYYDLNLKYNVYEDEVLMRLITKAGGGTIKLFKDHIDSFEIAGSSFIKILEKDSPSLNMYGFYEIAFSNSRFTLYTKHIKKNFERKDRKSLYFEFLKGQSEHVLLYNDTYTIVNSKKDIIELFPSQKKEIEKFYNVARSLRKSNPDGFQVSLMKRIEILLSRTENQSGE